MLGTGGRRARTVAILVGVVAVVGGLFVDRAIADTGDPAPAAVAAREQPLVSGTPCSVSARSCVDLDSQHAWLIDNGKVSPECAVIAGPLSQAWKDSSLSQCVTTK